MSLIIDTRSFLWYFYCSHIYMTKGVDYLNNVRIFREKEGLSQFALAKEIGVARQTINLIENNKYNPSLDLCIKLAKRLNSDLNELFWEEKADEK